jgi:hypothetical protein
VNLQLVLARSAAADAQDNWRAHCRDCPKCISAMRARKPASMCNRGGILYADHKACQADLARERKLARQPLPGQEALFGEDEVAGQVIHQTATSV